MSINDALLALLLHDESGTRGRTLLQKKLYFMGVLVKEDFGFLPHYYGPYSSAVADQLGVLCEAGFISEQAQSYADLIRPFGELRRFDYRLTENGKGFASVRSKELASYNEALNKINLHTISSNTKLLSIAAKVHFIVREEKSTTSSNIRKRAKELGWAVGKNQINEMVSYLELLGLVRTK